MVDSGETGQDEVVDDTAPVVLERAAAVLGEKVSSLKQAVTEATAVRDELISLRHTGHLNRVFIVSVFCGLILDVSLTAVLSIVLVGQVDNTNRIDSMTNRLDQAQTVQKSAALCPLYQLFLGLKTPAGRAAAISRGTSGEVWDKEFEVIQQGYDALSCKALSPTGK